MTPFTDEVHNCFKTKIKRNNSINSHYTFNEICMHIYFNLRRYEKCKPINFVDMRFTHKHAPNKTQHVDKYFLD